MRVIGFFVLVFFLRGLSAEGIICKNRALARVTHLSVVVANVDTEEFGQGPDVIHFELDELRVSVIYERKGEFEGKVRDGFVENINMDVYRYTGYDGKQESRSSETYYIFSPSKDRVIRSEQSGVDSGHFYTNANIYTCYSIQKED